MVYVLVFEKNQSVKDTALADRNGFGGDMTLTNRHPVKFMRTTYI